jgi:hypothetical protein
LPIDEERVRAYEQLMEAQSRIAARLIRAGVADAEIERALEACEPGHPEALAPDELYLGSLARFVDALGGRLRLAADFDDLTVAPPGRSAT